MYTDLVADLPIHPTTGLRALGWGRRGPIWPVMGGSQPTGEPAPLPPANPAPPVPPAPPTPPTPPAPPAPQPQPPATGDPGYPANTAVADMTPEQQAAYWKAQSRKHEDRVKAMGDYDDLKAKAGQFDQLAAASRTEHEKAIDDAKTEAARAAEGRVRSEMAGEMVTAHIRATVAGRLPEDKLAAALTGLDASKFMTAEHKVDADKVTAWVTAIVPAAPAPTRPPDVGQGRRNGGTSATSGIETGRDLYRERHPKKTPA